MEKLTPRQIVKELDKYIVGQEDAKRAVAVSLRNRWRRQHVESELREEIMPKNIIMVGPTGVGKTEIARRLSNIATSPFIKVEASKFTEVGYVGRDVESIIRDLTEIAVNEVRAERMSQMREGAERRAEDQILDILFPPPFKRSRGEDEGGAVEESQRQDVSGEGVLQRLEREPAAGGGSGGGDRVSGQGRVKAAEGCWSFVGACNCRADTQVGADEGEDASSASDGRV